MLVFVLALTSSVFINYQDIGDGSTLRIIFSIVNSFLVLVSVGIFELRQIMTLKLDYLKSFWNINDILLLISALVNSALEITWLIYVKHENSKKR